MTRSASPWDPHALPDQTGRTFLVTGATAGLGYFSSEQLAAAGAHVILSGRNPNRLAAARAAVLRRVPHARVDSMLLDVTNFGSLRAAAASLRSMPRIDGIVLNAGIVHPPRERQTVDGHELVLATNALGHFALAGELLPMLRKAGTGARLVWLGSVSTSSWRWPTVDPELEDDYSGPRAYVQSKLICQALAAEADRRLRGADIAVGSVIAHPGYSLGGRTRGIVGVNQPSKLTRFAANLQAPFAQSKEVGAHAQVRALIDPAVPSGALVAPRFLRGAPRIVERGVVVPETRVSRDPELGARMWAMCEAATQVRWRL